MAAPKFELALSKIDEAHSLDPKKITPPGADSPQPYELHYARKMSSYLLLREPNASQVLQLAIRAQHFRRWEVPRDSYPMTRVGYHAWRTFLKKRQGQLCAEIGAECGYSAADCERMQALIEKQGLKDGNPEAQVLEDVACLVFLDDQFEEFKEKHDEDKIVKILQKTWGKMSKKGQDMALEMQMEEDCTRLVEKALKG